MAKPPPRTRRILQVVLSLLLVVATLPSPRCTRPKQPGWGGVEFYPSFPMKAAVLLVRLTKNHAPGADLEAVEAEVAAWITERLHQRKLGSRSCGDTCGSSRLGDAREHLPTGCAQAASADPKRPHSPSAISRASAGQQTAPMAYALVSEVMDQTCRSQQVRGNRGGHVHSRLMVGLGSTRLGGGCLQIAAESQEHTHVETTENRH